MSSANNVATASGGTHKIFNGAGAVRARAGTETRRRMGRAQREAELGRGREHAAEEEMEKGVVEGRRLCGARSEGRHAGFSARGSRAGLEIGERGGGARLQAK